MSTVPHHVAAAVLVREGRVLLCHRRDDRPWFPSVWDLPGGHVEPKENARTALVRECHEELGIEVLNVNTPLTITAESTTLTVFTVRSWDGEPVNAAPEEHQAIGWFTPPELAGLPLADERLLPLLEDIVRRSVTSLASQPSRLPDTETDRRQR